MDKKKIPPFKLNSYKVDELKLDNTLSDHSGQVAFKFIGEFDTKNKIFKVKIYFREHVVVNTKKKERLYLVLNGEFEFTEERKFEEIPDFFWANSIAILYPYLRSVVSLITLHSNDKTFILPLINLSSYGPELKENTEIIS